MRSLEPGLLTLTENPVFRVSIAEFLGPAEGSAERANLATWITSVPRVQTGWIPMGGMRASPQSMVTLLGQLQKKLQQTIRESEDVGGPYPAVVRDTVKPKRSGVEVTRLLLMSEERNRDWKLKMIWVCAMDQVRAWIEMPESDLYQRGSVHLVPNVGNFRQDQVSLQPVVNLERGSQVVVVILADIHEFIHMYEALVRLRPMLEGDVGSLAATSSEGLAGLRANAFNAWLGLNQPVTFVLSSVWDRYLGPQRDVFLQGVAAELGIVGFSANQCRVLSEIQGWWGQNNLAGCCHRAADKQPKSRSSAGGVQCSCPENGARLRRATGEDRRVRVLVLGVEKEGEVDLFEERCAAIATEVFERHQEFYDAVDELLELVPADRLDVISIVLGWRFIHLQKVVHDAMQLEQQRHLDAVQCVACTTSFMSKMAGNGGWERRFRGRRRQAVRNVIRWF